MIAEEEFQALLRLYRSGAMSDAGHFHIATGLSLLCAELDQRLNDIDQKQQEIYTMLRDLKTQLDKDI